MLFLETNIRCALRKEFFVDPNSKQEISEARSRSAADMGETKTDRETDG